MKKLITALALIVPTLANAGIKYTYDQTQLDGENFTVSQGDYGFVSDLDFGENEFEYGYSMDPLYYRWDIKFDLQTTSPEIAKEDFLLIAVGNGFYGMTASFNGARSKAVTGQFDSAAIEEFFMFDPRTGKDYLSQLNDGFDLSLILYTKDNYGWYSPYNGSDGITIGFRSGNSWTLANDPKLIPEPYTAALFGLPLAFIGFRRFKSK